MSTVSQAFRFRPLGRLRSRAQQRGLHGHEHISNQRAIALFLTYFAAIRTVFWLSMMAQQILGVHWVVSLTHSVSFVAFISFYANGFTDFGTFTSGLAALFSADSHHDSEHTRQVITSNFQDMEVDIAKLAEIQPGPEGRALAESICQRLSVSLKGDV